jgi:hypothetical protein
MVKTGPGLTSAADSECQMAWGRPGIPLEHRMDGRLLPDDDDGPRAIATRVPG